MLKYNINDYMYIQITDKGFEHLKSTVGEDYIIHCIEGYKQIINGEIWYKLQMHHVFELFPINIAYSPYFKTNILFEDSSFQAINLISEEDLGNIGSDIF